MYESELDRESVGSFINCTNMDAHDVRLLALARGLTGAVCFLVCVVTMLLVMSRSIVALRESTQARLMAYLLFSTAAYLLVLSTHIEHYWNYDGSGNNTAQRHHWQVSYVSMPGHSHIHPLSYMYIRRCIFLLQVDLCVAIGLADQYTGTVQLFFTVGVAAYFVYHSLKFFCKQSNTNMVFKRRVWEILLVVVSVVVPALYVWVPFTAVPYGETGPWCWIRSLDRHCRRLKGTFWEQMGIWYLPFGVAAFSSFFAIVLFLVGLCRYLPNVKKGKGQKKGEACVLIAFLCTYCLLFLIEFISDVISEQLKTDYFSVWMLYAISTPLSGVTLPIGLLIYTYTGTLRDVVNQYCRCQCIRHRRLFITMFRDPSSFTCEHTRTSDAVQPIVEPECMSVQTGQPQERTPLLNKHTGLVGAAAQTATHPTA